MCTIIQHILLCPQSSSRASNFEYSIQLAELYLQLHVVTANKLTVSVCVCTCVCVHVSVSNNLSSNLLDSCFGAQRWEHSLYIDHLWWWNRQVKHLNSSNKIVARLWTMTRRPPLPPPLLIASWVGEVWYYYCYLFLKLLIIYCYCIIIWIF